MTGASGDIGVIDATIGYKSHSQPATRTAPRSEERRAQLLAFLRSLLLRGLSISAGVALWYWAVRLRLDWVVHFDNIPSPEAVVLALWQQLHHGKFYLHIAVSLRRIAIAYGLAAGLGIALGLLMGRWRVARHLLIPYIELLRPIPAVAWIPLAIL
jgi:NitT/TauT family transport system permease protein